MTLFEACAWRAVDSSPRSPIARSWSFGTATLVSDDVEKARVLDLFVDAVLPGRASEVRAMNDAERRLTMVVAVAIDEASAKLSSGPTDDPTRTSTYRCGPEWCPPESTTDADS